MLLKLRNAICFSGLQQLAENDKYPVLSAAHFVLSFDLNFVQEIGRAARSNWGGCSAPQEHCPRHEC
jgi:hypothetical protein